MGLLFRDRTMLDALWHDEHLSGTKVNIAIPQLDRKLALQDEEEIVRVVVLVPSERNLDLNDHEIVAIELTDG